MVLLERPIYSFWYLKMFLLNIALIKGIKPRFPLAIAVYVLEKDPRSKSTREAPLLLKESS